MCRAPESWHHLPLLGPQRCDLKGFSSVVTFSASGRAPWFGTGSCFCRGWPVIKQKFRLHSATLDGCRTPEVATPSLFGSTTTTVVTSSDLVGNGTTAATTAMDEDVTFFSSPASATTTAPQATHMVTGDANSASPSRNQARWCPTQTAPPWIHRHKRMTNSRRVRLQVQASFRYF